MNNLLLFPSPSEFGSPQPPDAAAREEALDVRRSFIVQAPAGSGKTALLIQRFLKLLADHSISQPEQVLALTFTNAATAEMRDRILGYLERARTMPTQDEGFVESLAAAATAAQKEDANDDFDRLTMSLARDVLRRDSELGWQLFAHPQRLNIRTIDSLSAQIANSLPVLSGSGGRLTPIEDASPLHREAARRTLLQLGAADAAFNHALRNLLLHRDGNLDDCEALLADMLALREQWGELIPLRAHELDDTWLDANLLPRLELALEQTICAALTRLDALFPSDVLEDLASLAGRLAHLPGTSGEASPLAGCAGRHEAPAAVAAHLDQWLALIHLLVTAGGDWRRGFAAGHLKFELDKNHPCRAELAAVVDQLRGRDDLLEAFAEVRALPGPRYPENQWAVAKSLFRVLRRALVELQLVFAAGGQCDFTELSLLARAALDAGPGAGDFASALGARLQHLLVDEMQDTSTGQYDLLELLTKSWDGHSQTVFLVGDPRQSIYLFRQARVERFVKALETRRLGDLPLTPLALTANFRSQRTLVNQFNHDFGLIFPGAANTAHTGANALPYLRAAATRPAASSAAGRVWHINPQPPAKASAQTLAASLATTQADRDAETVARIAADWLQRSLPAEREEPWRIAVLVRSRVHLDRIIPALRRAGVLFRAVDIETLRDRQEVLDLTALTRALLHPADRVAGLAVLRAPWCGLPLADLHTLTGADDPSLRQHAILRLIDERAHLLSPESQPRVARVQHVLRAAGNDRARFTAAQLVERAWRSLGGDAPLAPAQLVNAKHFFELLDALEASAGRIDSIQLEDRLTRLYAEPETVPANSGCVELLTIHKAKGLEWDVVFLPALERRPAGTPPRLLTWSVLDDLEGVSIMLAPIAARGEDVDPLTSWLKRRHRDREYAENKRLFYVACTRAREELHLFAAPPLTAQGVSSGPADSLLRAAWAAAASQVPAAPTVAVDSEDKDSTVLGTIEIDEAQTADENLLPRQYPIIHRLPLAFDPAARLAGARSRRLPYDDSAAAMDPIQLTRPEGSLAARSFGNAVHACMELLARKVAAGATAALLVAESAAWSGRITALLRADGLPPATVARLTRETRAALENLLTDPDGQWILQAHADAATESSLTAAFGPGMSTIRADRIFRAGAEPRSFGDTHLWIIDYKTASPGTANTTDFLAAQHATYAAQLEAYARVLAPAYSAAPEDVRLALYFPALPVAPRLVWWPMVRQDSGDAELVASQSENQS